MAWFTKQSLGLANWAWLAIALVVVVAIIVIIALVLYGNNKNAQKEHSAFPLVESGDAEEQKVETEAPVVQVKEEKAAETVVKEGEMKENKTEPAKARTAAKPAEKKATPAAKPVEKKEKPAAKPVAAEAKTDNRPKVYHITLRKSDGMWQVKAAGAEKAIKLFKTQAEAIEYCKPLAENQEANIMIHKKDGSFRKLTY